MVIALSPSFLGILGAIPLGPFILANVSSIPPAVICRPVPICSTMIPFMAASAALFRNSILLFFLSTFFLSLSQAYSCSHHLIIQFTFSLPSFFFSNGKTTSTEVEMVGTQKSKRPKETEWLHFLTS